ncbi:MAG: hypothetical protein ACOC43_01805 [Desulfohalobiaceae bacterium]
MRPWSRTLLGLYIFFCIWAFSNQAWGSPYVLEQETGRIDWHTGLVMSQGQGFLPQQGLNNEQARKMALRQALIQARQSLWRTLQGIRIHQDLTLQDLLQDNKHVRSRVQGLVHNAQILDKIVIRDQILLVTVGINLWGDFARLVIPDAVWFSASSNRSSSLDGDSGPFLQKQLLEVRAQAYTGLILQARGLDVEPALVCTVQDEEGNHVFGPAQADPQIALKQGMALFAQSADPRLNKNVRVGSHPLRVSVLESGSESGCHLVVDSDSGALLRQVARQPGNFLQKCRVLIELDPPPDKDLQEYRLRDR